MERLASGLTVIITRHCGVADIIQHKKNGLIVENPESAEEVADNINILFDPVLRHSMGQNARTLAEQFSVEKNTREMLKAYQEVIATQGK